MPEVIEYKVSGIFNKVVNFECPNCHVPLSTALKDAGKDDACPHCGHKFISPGTEILEKQTALAAKKQAAAAHALALKEAEARAIAVAEHERLVEATAQKPPPMPAPPMPAPPSVGSPDTAGNSVCTNCGGKIGRLEKPHMWGDSVVCFECYERLIRQNAAPMTDGRNVPASGEMFNTPRIQIRTEQDQPRGSRGVLIFIAVVLAIGVGVLLIIVGSATYSGYQAQSVAYEKARVGLIESSLKLARARILEFADEHGGRFPMDSEIAGLYFRNGVQYVGGDLPPMSEDYRNNNDDLIQGIIVCYEQDSEHPNHIYVAMLGFAYTTVEIDYMSPDANKEPFLWKTSNDVRIKIGLKRLPLPTTLSKK